jgi:hypothetical protein
MDQVIRGHQNNVSYKDRDNEFFGGHFSLALRFGPRPRLAQPNTAALLGIEDFASGHELKMQAAFRSLAAFGCA